MFVVKAIHLLATLIFIGSFSNLASGESNGDVETIFLTGFPAPGIPGDVDILGPTLPATINQSGEFALATTLSGAGMFDRALFGGQPELPELIAHEGGQAPDLPAGITIEFLSSPILGEQGTVGFQANLAGPGVNVSNDFAFFTGTSAELNLAIHEGSPAPGTVPGISIGGFSVRAFNASGQFAVISQLTGIGVNGSNNFAIFARTNDSLELVARLGDSAPGIGGEFLDLPEDRILMNDSGQIVFVAETTSGFGIFQFSNGVLDAVAVEGEPAPGTPPGTTYEGFFEVNIGLNDMGQIAFVADLVDLAGASTHAVFSNASGFIEPIAMTGQDAPGVPLSGNFNQFSGLVINGDGKTAFVASLIGLGIDATNDSAVYAEVNDSMRLVARKGFPAAGTVGGVDYNDFERLSMNHSGQLVFGATLGGNVTPINDSAIYVASNGYPQLLVREGFLFDVNEDPGNVELRFIDRVDQGSAFFGTNSGGQDGQRTSINDAGQVIFDLEFNDSTFGAFVVDCSFLLGDVNGDGTVDLLDIAPFVDLITTGVEFPEADINGDGTVDLLDVAPFVSLLTS